MDEIEDNELMTVTQHPRCLGLIEWERDLVDRLVDSAAGRQVLPFRADARITRAVIVAAECAKKPGVILVVSPEEFTEGWVRRWQQEGQCGVFRSKTRNQDRRVVVTTVKELRDNPIAFALITYSVIVIAGGVSEKDADWITETLTYERAWWLVSGPDHYSWPLGVIEQVRGYFPVPEGFWVGPRHRPSGLAERVQAVN